MRHSKTFSLTMIHDEDMAKGAKDKGLVYDDGSYDDAGKCTRVSLSHSTHDRDQKVHGNGEKSEYAAGHIDPKKAHELLDAFLKNSGKKFISKSLGGKSLKGTIGSLLNPSED